MDRPLYTINLIREVNRSYKTSTCLFREGDPLCLYIVDTERTLANIAAQRAGNGFAIALRQLFVASSSADFLYPQ
jgi:hypothetical protein